MRAVALTLALAASPLLGATTGSGGPFSMLAPGGGAVEAADVTLADAGACFETDNVEAALAQACVEIPGTATCGSGWAFQSFDRATGVLTCGPPAVPPVTSVAGLPECADETPALWAVNDGASATDCTVGGGSTEVLCACLDGAWGAVGGGPTNYAASASPAGPATTALALGSNGTNCGAGNYARGVDAAGNAENCTADGPATYASSVSAAGPATTATALGANPTNCSAGNYPLGIDASGNVESCTSAPSGGIGGSTGAVDNALLCSDGTGGATAQACNADSTIAGDTITLGSAGARLVVGDFGSNRAGIKYPGGAAYFAVNNDGSTLHIQSPSVEWRDGGRYMHVTQAAINVGASTVINLANHADPMQGSADVGSKRQSAGVWGFTNGSSGGGTIQLGDPGTKPTCDSTTRGRHWHDFGGAGVADTYEVCGKSSLDVYAWVALATF